MLKTNELKKIKFKTDDAKKVHRHAEVVGVVDMAVSRDELGLKREFVPRANPAAKTCFLGVRL